MQIIIIEYLQESHGFVCSCKQHDTPSLGTAVAPSEHPAAVRGVWSSESQGTFDEVTEIIKLYVIFYVS